MVTHKNSVKSVLSNESGNILSAKSSKTGSGFKIGKISPQKSVTSWSSSRKGSEYFSIFNAFKDLNGIDTRTLKSY